MNAVCWLLLLLPLLLTDTWFIKKEKKKVLLNLVQLLFSGSLIIQLFTLHLAGHNLPSNHVEPPSLNVLPILRLPCFDGHHHVQKAFMVPCLQGVS